MPQQHIIFATNNAHKVAEIRHVLSNELKVDSLKEAGILVDIPEPHATLEENASEKSKTIFSITGKNCFSEDTGLEVFVLNGEPGVRSARYAGDSADFAANNEKLLGALEGNNDRRAQFRTVISLIWKGKEYQFEGICTGNIIKEKRGKDGFGYDPIFVPDGAEKTFAEMNLAEKSVYSHRRKATDKFVAFLKAQHGQN